MHYQLGWADKKNFTRKHLNIDIHKLPVMADVDLLQVQWQVEEQKRGQRGTCGKFSKLIYMGQKPQNGYYDGYSLKRYYEEGIMRIDKPRIVTVGC